MSPSKAFMTSMKMPKPGMPMQSGGPQGQMPPNLRKDLNYPLGSIEGTQPVLKPRRKLTSKDTGTKCLLILYAFHCIFNASEVNSVKDSNTHLSYLITCRSFYFSVALIHLPILDSSEEQ